MYNMLPTYKKFGLVASIIGTVLVTIGLILTFAVPGGSKTNTAAGSIANVVEITGIIVSVVAYFTGGLIEALKSAFHIIAISWLCVPFPFMIVTGVFGTAFGLYFIVACPVIPIYRSCKNYVERHYWMESDMYDEA